MKTVKLELRDFNGERASSIEVNLIDFIEEVFSTMLTEKEKCYFETQREFNFDDAINAWNKNYSSTKVFDNLKAMLESKGN